MEKKKYDLAGIKEINLKEISLDDNFFNSLRKSYNEFDTWYQTKADQNKKAWIKFDEFGNIDAFLFLQLKIENEVDIENLIPGKTKLKISTFKINDSNSIAGKRISEVFMSIIFELAIYNSVETIYVTLFKENDHIKGLYKILKDWGFKDFSKKKTENGSEDVLIKKTTPNSMNSIKENYPFYSLEQYKNNNFYCVPFEVKFHDQLFPDNSLKNTLNQSKEFDISSYSITKTYISSISFLKMKSGDFILEYRKKDINRKGCATGIGIILEIYKSFESFDDFKNKVGNTSIYDNNELEKIFNENKKRLNVLKILHIYSLGEGKNIWYNDLRLFFDQTVDYPMAYSLKNKNKLLELLKNKGFKII